VSHSLGARVVLQSVRSLIVRRFQVSQICLMAAAVDDSSLAHPAVYLEAAAKTGRIAVLASRRDRILKFGYPLGDFLKAFLSPRDRPGAALGYHGPRAAATDPFRTMYATPRYPIHLASIMVTTYQAPPRA